MSPIQVYGAEWCGDTTHARRHLDALGVEYDYHDVDEDASAADWVKQQNNGKQKLPTLEIDGEVLSNPRDSQLDKVLRSKGFVA